MKGAFVLSFVLLALLSGCASIMSGSNQSIRITSSPDEAKVVIFDQNNMKVWESSTPTSVSLKRGAGYFSGASYRVEITKSGYKKQTIQLSSSLNGGWYLAGNFLLGGFIGWLIVDPISGAMWTLNMDNINTDLAKEVSLNPKDGSICVLLKDQISEDVFSKLELTQIN